MTTYTPSSNNDITISYSGSASGELLCAGLDTDRMIAGVKNLGTSTDKDVCISKCVAYTGSYSCDASKGCTSATTG
jgi:hypothetical protein